MRAVFCLTMNSHTPQCMWFSACLVNVSFWKKSAAEEGRKPEVVTLKRFRTFLPDCGTTSQDRFVSQATETGNSHKGSCKRVN